MLSPSLLPTDGKNLVNAAGGAGGPLFAATVYYMLVRFRETGTSAKFPVLSPMS